MTAAGGLSAGCWAETRCPTASPDASTPTSGCSRRPRLAGGGHLVATSLGCGCRPTTAARRLGWHLVSKASWQGGALALVEAQEAEDDRRARCCSPTCRRAGCGSAEPGRRAGGGARAGEASIRSRHHRDLPGGGAWFVQRKVPGRDGMVLQVRPDPGTDPAAVRQVAADVARTLGRAR